MNIFVLDKNPTTAAKYMCNKHIVKMALETAQILSTVLRKKGINKKKLYKATHSNHPCTIWAGDSFGNYLWLLTHGLSICSEYQRRYNKRHKSLNVILAASKYMPGIPHWKKKKLYRPPSCMPPEVIKPKSVIKSYRNYYIKNKASFAKWPTGEIPKWFKP